MSRNENTATWHRQKLLLPTRPRPSCYCCVTVHSPLTVVNFNGWMSEQLFEWRTAHTGRPRCWQQVFLPCDAMRCTVFVIVILSVRVCIHMVRPTIMISSPYGSPIILVSGDNKLIPKFEEDHPERGRWMRVGWVRIGDFRPISSRISETVRYDKGYY